MPNDDMRTRTEKMAEAIRQSLHALRASGDPDFESIFIALAHHDFKADFLSVAFPNGYTINIEFREIFYDGTLESVRRYFPA